MEISRIKADNAFTSLMVHFLEMHASKVEASVNQFFVCLNLNLLQFFIFELWRTSLTYNKTDTLPIHYINLTKPFFCAQETSIVSVVYESVFSH